LQKGCDDKEKNENEIQILKMYVRCHINQQAIAQTGLKLCVVDTTVPTQRFYACDMEIKLFVKSESHKISRIQTQT